MKYVEAALKNNKEGSYWQNHMDLF